MTWPLNVKLGLKPIERKMFLKKLKTNQLLIDWRDHLIITGDILDDKQP